MKLVQCETPPRYQGGYCSDPCELEVGKSSEYHFTPSLMKHIDIVFYWYGVDCYEGAGRAIVFWKDGTIGLYDLGHCSCYGPLKDFYNDTSGDYENLDSIQMSDEELECCVTVLEAAYKFERSTR